MHNKDVSFEHNNIWLTVIINYLSSHEQLHIKQECNYVKVMCPNGCGEKLPKKEVSFIRKVVCTSQNKESTFDLNYTGSKTHAHCMYSSNKRL